MVGIEGYLTRSLAAGAPEENPATAASEPRVTTWAYILASANFCVVDRCLGVSCRGGGYFLRLR